MAKRHKLSISPVADGLQTVEMESWTEFSQYVNTGLRNPHDYIFRGQKQASWKLETSLDRGLKSLKHSVSVGRHLEQFQRSTLGRRGVNPQKLDEDGWWALGQHYGLWTPLLDWTDSPFVALYFAFAESNRGGTGKRVVFALSRPLVQTKSASIARKALLSPARPDVLDIVMPELDENARLINQAGLFTRSSAGVDIGSWVKNHFKGDAKEIALVKVVIQERIGDRLEVLRSLNRMNINHRSLFPDIGGSAEFCNMRLSITGY